MQAVEKLETPDFQQQLVSFVANTGETLSDITTAGKTLVVFLRHGGCTFCREALEDIRRQRSAIENERTRIVLVHMMDDADARRFFDEYGLADVARISDPERDLYRAFRLEEGTLSQLAHWKVWWRGVIAGIVHRHGAGRLRGNARQMPGVFLLEDGEIRREFRHRTAADRPDYTDMACSVGGGPHTAEK